MSSLRTEVTEIVTGLAMLGYRDLKQALEVRPGHILNVQSEHFDRLAEALDAGKYADQFATAWENGAVFARSNDGLRGRPPWSIEWKGPQKPPGYEQIPADLRIDHVYLVSCKYGSTIVHNASPAHLFDRQLAERRTERGNDWFADVAPEAYQELYRTYRAELGLEELPPDVADLTPEHRGLIKAASQRGPWPGSSNDAYADFVVAVGRASADRWLTSLSTPSQREQMLWRLLRLQAAPYFVLGATHKGEPLRYRVGTPWDFRHEYSFVSFDAWADPAGQPLVKWRADTIRCDSGEKNFVEGHVEVRWSHGRFSGAPEAKVHLTSDPNTVSGYTPLA